MPLYYNKIQSHKKSKLSEERGALGFDEALSLGASQNPMELSETSKALGFCEVPCLGASKARLELVKAQGFKRPIEALVIHQAPCFLTVFAKIPRTL